MYLRSDKKHVDREKKQSDRKMSSLVVLLRLSLSSHRLGWVQDNLDSEEVGQMLLAVTLRTCSGRIKVL